MYFDYDKQRFVNDSSNIHRHMTAKEWNDLIKSQLSPFTRNHFQKSRVRQDSADWGGTDTRENLQYDDLHESVVDKVLSIEMEKIGEEYVIKTDRRKL